MELNVCVLLYDGMWMQEPILAINRVRNENITYVGLEKKPYMSYEKLPCTPERIISELDPTEVDLLIIPGGSADHLLDEPQLKEFVGSLNGHRKLIAGICYGAVLMANYGVLEGKKCTGDSAGITTETPSYLSYEKSTIIHAGVVVDDNVISATGAAYLEFAEEVARVVKDYKIKSSEKAC